AQSGAVVPVWGDDGGLELEVWPPAPGCTGGGLVVPDPGDGWEEPVIERYVTRWEGEELVVELEHEDGAIPSPRPVRVRGLGGRRAQM
ncbi:glycosyl hydrolase, partial [Streptomyces sp. NPDC059374]